MFLPVLLPEQPVECGLPLRHRQPTGRRQGIHRQRCDPRREVRVNRPAPVFARRLTQEAHRVFDHGIVVVAGGDETHHHETGERDCFKVPAACRLAGPQDLQGARTESRANLSQQRIPRRRMMMAYLPERHERRQRVAHDRQTHPVKPLVRTRGQFEGKLRNASPGLAARPEASRQR